MVLKTCKHCNGEISNFWNFCPHCGEKLQSKKKQFKEKTYEFASRPFEREVSKEEVIENKTIELLNQEEVIEEKTIESLKQEESIGNDDQKLLEDKKDIINDQTSTIIKNPKITSKVKKEKKKKKVVNINMKKVLVILTSVILILTLFLEIGYVNYQYNDLKISILEVFGAVVTSFISYKLVEFRFNIDTGRFTNYLTYYVVDEHDNMYIKEKIFIFVCFLAFIALVITLLLMIIRLFKKKSLKKLSLVHFIVGMILFVGFIFLGIKVSYGIFLYLLVLISNLYFIRISIN